MQLHEIKQDNTTIWVSEQAQTYFQVEWFEDKQSHAVLPVEGRAGRQAVSRFDVGEKSMLMRHYCRGGFPAHFTRDQFIFRGNVASRPYQEINLLLKMFELKLPVPQAVAARIVTRGVTYTADIIMHEIKNAETLAHIISNRQLSEKLWAKVGETIRLFHKQGIQHVDLNANNILIDTSGNVYLIDFDRCVQKSYSSKWADAGLKRLKRSLLKIKNVKRELFFSESDFSCLMKGYEL